MQDARDVICEAAKGHVEEIARRREISSRRMYEILAKDNPYPKTKRLIRDIATVNQHGVRLIKADLATLFADVLDDPAEQFTVKDLHKEAFDAIDAQLAGKSAAQQIRELRELIVVCEEMVEAIEKFDKRNGPKRVA